MESLLTLQQQLEHGGAIFGPAAIHDRKGHPRLGIRVPTACGAWDGGQSGGRQKGATRLAPERGDVEHSTLLIIFRLDELGFDVALAYGVALMPNGSGGPHCVLAAHLPSSPPLGDDYIMDRTGKKYYLWEMTAKNMNLGQWNWTASNLNNWNLVKL